MHLAAASWRLSLLLSLLLLLLSLLLSLLLLTSAARLSSLHLYSESPYLIRRT
jgi:hypothetical protein